MNLALLAHPGLLADFGGAIVGGLILLWVVVAILCLGATLFWICMLIDVLTSNRDTMEKILWFLVVFFLHFLGALIYYFVGRTNRTGSVSTPTTN